MSLLSESDEELDNLTINQKFAGEFERKERDKELSRAKELLTKGRITEEEDDDDSESESEDDDAQLLSAELDLKIFNTIKSLRKRDPKVYDTNTKWFSDGESDESTESYQNNAKGNSEVKKKRYKDIVRAQILEQHGGDSDDDPDQRAGDGSARRKSSLVYDAEQERIRQQFLQSAAAAASESESGDEDHDSTGSTEESGKGIIRIKKGPPKDLGEQEKAVQAAVDEWRQDMLDVNTAASAGAVAASGMQAESGPASVLEAELEEIGDPTEFLANYMKQQKWRDRHSADAKLGVRGEEVTAQGGGHFGGVGDTGGDVDSGDDEQDADEVDKMEQFESKYNFRFEELEQQGGTQSAGGAVQVMGHARTVDGSLRRADDKRKRQREERRERKAKERRQQEAELRRLKNLKRQEVSELTAGEYTGKEA